MAQSTSKVGTTDSTTDSTEQDKATSESDASGVRRESQNQTDHVAMVSRTATGEAHQHPGYEVIGLPEDADEKKVAAAENRPER